MRVFSSRRDHDLWNSGSKEMKRSLGISASGLRGLNSRYYAKIWRTSSMTSVETDLCASKSMISEDVS
jgi:hypothetical protein